MAKTKKKRERHERRFLPTSTVNPLIVMATGALGALALGAGTFGQFFSQLVEEGEAYRPALWLFAGGSLFIGIAIWLGTSAEAALRVGDTGITIEKGGLARIPWWKVASITWDQSDVSLVVNGKDESDREYTVRVSSRAHNDAVAWIVKEATDRVPNRIDLSEEVRAKIPAADPHAGTSIRLEPMQLVGKRCATSGKIIAYEPDARICPMCELVYHKLNVPKKCACGTSLADLRAKDSDDSDDDETERASEENSSESAEAT